MAEKFPQEDLNLNTTKSQTNEITLALKGSTKDEIKNSVSDAADVLASKIDSSLECYHWLNDRQKDVIRGIEARNPGAIESITEDEIVINSVVDGEKLQTALPLKDTVHDTLKPVRLPKNFIDARIKEDQKRAQKGLEPLTKHDYITGDNVEKYYEIEQHKNERLNQAEVESIIKLMPSGNDYKYAIWGQPMKQFTTLLGLTDQDLTSLALSDGGAYSGDLGYFGGAWLGAKDDDGDLLRAGFVPDKADLDGNDRRYAFRARFLKKLSS